MKPTSSFSGLSEEEIAKRIAAGQRNVIQHKSSRTIPQILRTNVLTFFNLLNVIRFAGPFSRIDQKYVFYLAGGGKYPGWHDPGN